MSARRIRRDRERYNERAERRLSARSKATAVGAGVGAVVLFAPALAQADTFTVNKLADTDDNTCDSDCSLREAVYEANDTAGADTITFATGLTGTITLDPLYGQLEVKEETTITGPGADVLAVSGDDATRIFYIDVSTYGTQFGDATLSGLELTHGDADTDDGGALYTYDTTLTLEDMAVTDNAGSEGGAMHTDRGNVFISDSYFSGNEATSWGGVLYLEDTQDTPSTTDVEFRVSDSTFVDNTSDDSGGALDLDNPQGDSVVENSTFIGNHADDQGGGITVNETLSDGADVTVTGSTFTDNTANTGGAFYTEDVTGTTLIDNSTMVGNESEESGGAVYFATIYDDQVNAIRNSTIVDNTAGADASLTGDYAGGGVYLSYSTSTDAGQGPIEISSTIVAGNHADSGVDLGQEADTDGFDVAHSLIGDTSGAQINDAGNNIFGTDPDLGALQDNGGPTETLLPNLASPVIDAGVANGFTTDQRGLPRTFDPVSVPNKPGSDGTDIGATELQAGENGLPGNGECQGAVVPSQTANDSGSVLTGTEGSDQLIGAAGDDTLSGLGANDCLTGEAGNDIADGGAGNDLVSGGDGNDTLKGVGGKDKLTGEGGKDKANGGAGKDKVTGGGGKDKLKGSGGKDKVSGGGGKDKINPGNGKDKVKAGGGKDKINTADGKKDKLNCGGGKDKATVDAKDKVKANCDVVKVKG